MFPAEAYPDLLVGLNEPDDSAVYRLSDDRAIISTMDFFPPVVDDPYAFGAIAAANALSDVYAMGGKPLMAINLAAFPDEMDKRIITEIFRGGAEKVREAGAVIAGGHTVADKEPKYGLAVTGIIDPEKVKPKGGAQPGDVLLLTKPLGVGVVTTALKNGITDEADIDVAVASMKTLNKDAAEAAQVANATSLTDITGFGLIGHAHEMAHLGEVDFHIQLETLPWLPGALRYGEAGAFPGGMGRNLEYFGPWTKFGSGVSQLVQDMLMTPETSGGLLVALPADQVETFTAHCETAVTIGHVTTGAGFIHIHG